MGPTGLEKVVLEVPLKSGLIEKIAPELSPPEGMYRLENVELDKIGSYKRRQGFRALTTAGLGPGSPGTIGVPRKVAGRAHELFCIADDRSYLGSGGGAGNAGFLVWSYSPEQRAWRPHGKVPSTTLERAFGIVSGQRFPSWHGCAFVRQGLETTEDRRHVVMGYVSSDWAMQSPGVHAQIWDVESRTSILGDTILDPLTNVKLEVHQSTLYAILLYREDTAVTPGARDFKCSTYDCTQPGLGIVSFTLLAASSEGSRGWTAVTDDGHVFLLTINTANEVIVRKYQIPSGAGALTLVATSAAISSSGSTCQPGLHVAGGRVHVAFRNSGGRPSYASLDAGTLTSITGPIEVHSTASVTDLGHVVVVGTSSNDACVMWQNTNTPINTNPIYWRWVKAASTAPELRLNVHRSPGQLFLTHPFIRNSRVYVGVTGTGAPTNDGIPPNSNGSNYGHLLMEIPSDASQEDNPEGNPFVMMMPVALWSRDVSINMGTISRIANASSNEDTEFYLVSARESRRFDTFYRESQQNLFPTPHTASIWNIDVMELHFTDRWRWQHAEIDQQTTLACSLPYVYDGDRAHECGFIFRPSITAVQQVDLAADAAWSIGDTVLYRQVYEWEDFQGRRWLSDPSYPWAVVVEETTLGGSPKQIEISSGRPPWFSMKPDGANNFKGRIRVNTYRATSAAPDQYVLINSQMHMIWEGSGDRSLSLMGAFTDAGNVVLNTESIYTFGGELENYVAPSCRSLVQHRDRLFTIDLEDNSLKYSKPFREGRGIEWCRAQSLALPQRGMALASVEGSLLVFTDRSILVLEGAGPSPTGLPPDAFSRFFVLSQDHGCSEPLAAWRTPRGVVFRSRQGLWIVTPQQAVLYIGAPVEDYVRTVDRIVDGALDEKLGCLRLLVIRGQGLGAETAAFDTLVYWYDSDRWSVDHTHESFTGTRRSTLFHQGEYYHACDSAVFRRVPDRWQDGSELLASNQPTYRALIQTGWFKFDAQSGFRRLWRVLVTVKTADVTSGWGVKLTVETDGRSQSFSFDPNVFAEGEDAFDGTLRAHLKFQKGQRYRVTVEEEQGAALAAYNSGFTFTGIGFELGRKRGAAKLPRAQSAPTVT